MKYYNKCTECKKINIYEVDSEIDNSKNCEFCGSSNTIFVTKEYAEFYKNNDYKSERKKLLTKAKEYLKNKDYDNAFCFANMANIDTKESYLAFMIKVLSKYKLNKISDLLLVKEDLLENKDLKEAMNIANSSREKYLKAILNKNQEIVKKNKYKKANKLLKDGSFENLRLACHIFSDLEDYKDSKKRLALCRDKYQKQYEIYKVKTKKEENTKIRAVASIIFVIIVIVLLIIFYI